MTIVQCREEKPKGLPRRDVKLFDDLFGWPGKIIKYHPGGAPLQAVKNFHGSVGQDIENTEATSRKFLFSLFRGEQVCVGV